MPNRRFSMALNWDTNACAGPTPPRIFCRGGGPMSAIARLCIALTVLAGTLVAAAAQEYPARTVRIVVPFGAGGPADIYARFLGQRLQEALGQPFVIENRPGAGSIIGTEVVQKSAPDGYTLLLMSNTHTVNETLVPKKPFVLMKDFV